MSATTFPRSELRESSATVAAQLAQDVGFEVTVGDLTRYKSRATTWQLSDRELAVVATWQAGDQPYWWQHVWAPEGVALGGAGAEHANPECRMESGCRMEGEESEHG